MARYNLRAAEALLNLGADPLAVDTRRCSPVYHSVIQNEVEMFKSFISAERPFAQKARDEVKINFKSYVGALVDDEDFQLMVILGSHFKTARL